MNSSCKLNYIFTAEFPSPDNRVTFVSLGTYISLQPAFATLCSIIGYKYLSKLRHYKIHGSHPISQFS